MDENKRNLTFKLELDAEEAIEKAKELVNLLEQANQLRCDLASTNINVTINS